MQLRPGASTEDQGTRCPENKRKKPFKLNYDVVSEKHSCKKCGRPIKQRLVNQKKTTPDLCYRHYLESNGKTKAQRRE